MLKFPKYGAYQRYRDETTGFDVIKYVDGTCIITGGITHKITSENIGDAMQGRIESNIPNVLVGNNLNTPSFCNNLYTNSNSTVYSSHIVDNKTLRVFYHRVAGKYIVGDTISFNFLIIGKWK